MSEVSILVADDEQGICDLLEEMLHNEGYRVFLARNGKEALEVVKSWPIDMAILDLKMPVMNGLEAMKKIKEVDRNIEVLIMTAFADIESVRMAIIDCGAFDYILKPFHNVEIIHSTKNALLHRDFILENNREKKELKDRITQLDKNFEERTLHLRESQVKYRQIVENSNDVIVVAQEGKLKFANRMALELTGYTQNEILDVPFIELIDPEDRHIVMEKHKRILQGEDIPTTHKVLALKKNGESFWVEINSVVTIWEEKLATINVLRDITESVLANDARSKAHDELERAVEKRTIELVKTNEHLKNEIENRKQAEKMLIIEKDNFLNIFNSMEDGVYIVNQQYELEYINLALNKEFGPAEGQKCYEYFDDQEDVCEWCKNREVFAGKTVRWEWDSFKNQKTYDLIDTPLKNIDGSISKLTIFRDITEKKQTKEMLQISNDFLIIANQYTQMIPMLEEFVAKIKNFSGCRAVALRILDEEGNIPYMAYEGFSQRFYESESPLSIHTDQCMCINVIKGATDPELPFYTEGGSFYMNGTTRFLATVSEEEKGQTRNECNRVGYESVALIPIRVGERIIGLVHVADYQEEKVPIRVVEAIEKAAMQVGTAIQRVKSEETLKQQTHDLAESVKELNCLYGISSLEEKPGILLDEIIHGTIDLIHSSWQYPGITCSRIIIEDEEFKTKNFVESPWRQTMDIIVQGKVIGVVEVFYKEERPERDEGPFLTEERNLINAIAERLGRIIERKFLREKLIRSERLAATGQLAASIAHEINSPLQAITMTLSTLTEKCKEDNELKDGFELLRGAFVSIRDTVSNMLDLNRPGKEIKQFGNVNEILKKTVNLVRSYLKQSKVRVDLNLSSKIPNIVVSPQQLNHVFLNLIANSIEAMSGTSNPKNGWKNRTSTGGKITIKTNLIKGNIVIKVTDTGPGISAKDLNHIFDPFYTKKKKMGMGIGLSICHGIIEDHNGTIEAKNSPEGGAVFTITIPFGF